MKLFILLFSSFFLIPTTAIAQSNKIPVAVNHIGNDSVGQGVAFALKEAIRGSQALRFVDHEPTPSTPRIVVYISTLSVQEKENISSALSYSIAYDSSEFPALGALLTSIAGICGRRETETCAKNFLVRIDRTLEQFRRDWPNLWKTL